MEIKKVLEKINEIYSDFSSLFLDYEELKPKEKINNDILIAKNDLKSEMLSFYAKKIIENIKLDSEKQIISEKEDPKVKVYIDLFLNLMFDEVKKFKIIRLKKTGSK